MRWDSKNMNRWNERVVHHLTPLGLVLAPCLVHPASAHRVLRDLQSKVEYLFLRVTHDGRTTRGKATTYRKGQNLINDETKPRVSR